MSVKKWICLDTKIVAWEGIRVFNRWNGEKGIDEEMAT